MTILWGNSLTGRLPNNICDNLPDIKEIFVNENRLSGSIPSNLSSRRRLQILALAHNAFSGQIPEGIEMLPISIQVLHLGTNYLTGMASCIS